MPETFHDLPILGELGDALEAAMAREVGRTAATTPAGRATAGIDGPIDLLGDLAHQPERGRLRRRFPNPFRTLAIALLLAGLGTSTAAATLTVLRGSPIPVPRSIDVQPPMKPVVDSGQLLALRSADPGGGAPFALRRSTSETGLTCATVGQVQGDRFGVTGTDAVFRDMPAAVVDGCGQATDAGPAVMGARVFDAPDRADVRTVVYGLGGDHLEAASVTVRGTTEPLELSDSGAFLFALREYPEDAGLAVKLRFDGGKVVDYPLGAGIAMVVDPAGPAWRMQLASTSGYTGTCILVGAARPSHTTPQAPPTCGEVDLERKRDSVFRKDSFFSIRALEPGDRGTVDGQSPWNWHRAPARTLVTGYANPKRVKTVAVLGAGRPILPRRLPSGIFLVPLLPEVSPADIAVRLTFMDGRTTTARGSTNTITPRKSKAAIR